MPKAAKIDKLEAQELHRKVVRKFPRRSVMVRGINDVWCVDLVDMRQFSKSNKGYKWLLTCIDVLSRYAWAIPLKDKKGPTVLDAMSKIITESGRHPEKIWSDAGSEFINKEFKKNFDVYHTYGETHAAPIERFNRTLKSIMWYKMTKHSTKEWVSRLPKLLTKYNNTVHSSIKMTPKKASKKKNEKVLLMYQQDRADKIAKKVGKKGPKFQVGDIVRISRVKGVFEKGYTNRWSFDLYEIVNVLKTKPITYRVKDLQRGDVLDGSFYEPELQKSKIKHSKEGIYLEDE